MELSDEVQAALAAEAKRVGMSVSALIEWVALCGARDELSRAMESVDAAMKQHNAEHPRSSAQIFSFPARG